MAGAYRMSVPPESVDLHRFRALAAAARKSLSIGSIASAINGFRVALALWNGPACLGLASTHGLGLELSELTEERSNVVEELYRAQLVAGDHDGLVAGLRREVHRHPLRESNWRLLMLAFRAEGDNAAALNAYEELREVLASELGGDPSARTRDVYQDLLRGGLQVEAG